MSRFDVIVVGAGLTGSFAAKELACGGLKVALLDAGPILQEELFRSSSPAPNPKSSFSQSHRLKLLLTGERKKALNTAAQKHTHEFFLSEREHPYVATGSDFNWSRVRAVGGRGHLWGRVLLRFSDSDLRDHWPVSYDELAPFYEEVETLLELGGGASTSDQVPDGSYQKMRKLSSEEKLFCEAVARRWPERHAVINHVAEYEPGPLSPMLRLATASGNLQIFHGKVALKLENVSARNVDVFTVCANTGQQEIFQAPNIVLAASAFETLRLLLNSKSNAFPTGLGNSNGLLGRQILEHISASTFSIVPVTTEALNLSEHSPFKLNSEGTGFYMPPFEKFSRPDGGAATYGAQGVISGQSGMFFLGLFGSVAPRFDNRLTLHPVRHDRHGMPVPVIEFSLDKVEQDMWRHMAHSLEAMTKAYFEDAGIARGMSFAMRLRSLLQRKSRPAIGSNHESGGAPMGSEPGSSVVGPENRLWDAENVLVCDSSCFPSLPPQNPSLTAMALALRASRLLVQGK